MTGALRTIKKIEFLGQKYKEEIKVKTYKPRICIAAPTESILVTATLPKFIELLPEGTYRYNKSEGVFYFDNGVEVITRFVYSPRAVEGFTVDHFWLDEGALTQPWLYSKIKSRIAVRRGTIDITTTGQGTNWVYHEVYMRWMEGDKKINCFEFDSIDNPAFPKEEYYAEKKRMPPEEFAMRYQGRFTKIQGSIYGGFKLDEHVIHVPPNKFDVVIAGVDFGFASPYSVEVIGILDGVYYIIDEIYLKGINNQRKAQQCMELQTKYNIHMFFADSEDKDAIKEMKNYGVKVSKAKKDVIKGIDTVRGLIMQDKLFVVTKCREAIREFPAYSYIMKGDGDYKEEPVKKYDHCMDAIRYAIFSYKYNDVDRSKETVLDWVQVSKKEMNQLAENYKIPKFIEKMSNQKKLDLENQEYDTGWNYD